MAEASLLNYEAVVTCEAALMPRPLCVVGRGMGALVARLAARRVEPERLVLIDVEPVATRAESELALEESRRAEAPTPHVATLVLEGKIEPSTVVGWV